MSNLINVALTGIRLNQAALSVTGHNIVNANTEGYSRQSIAQTTNFATRTAAGYLGNGVQLDNIYRNTEKFLVDQVLRDVGVLSDHGTFLEHVTKINNLLAADQTNLAGEMSRYFDALNEAVNDPGSLLGRQLLLTQTQQLVAGFQGVDARLQAQNETINTQLTSAADAITSLALQIAEVNRVVSDSTPGEGRGAPNDLLDKLDLLVQELAAYVSVSTVSRGDGGLDVFIGQGQPLVVGREAQALKAVPGTPDGSRFELVFTNDRQAGGATRSVSSILTGGELGGLLRFRQEALDPAINSLGLLATALVDGINQQNQLGTDLEGSLGGLVFKDVNDAVVAQSRVKASANNTPPNDRVLHVTLDSVADLKASDYELVFNGPGRQYELVRLSDRAVVSSGALGSSMPQSIEVDGFSINLESGSFQHGDRFLIQPVAAGVARMQVQITRAEEFAFASPIRVESAVGNAGGATVLGMQVNSVDTGLFSKEGQLTPPMLVRFTSATTYDILDNSDPANPKPMVPALTSLRFTPGAENQLFPGSPGGTAIESSGAVTGAVQSGSVVNGYPGETLTFHTTDPDTGFIREQSVTLGSNEPAAVTARKLSALTGVEATAHSVARMTDFQSGLPGEPLQLQLNGVDLTDPNWTAPGQSSPAPVPDPVTADFLRDRINSSEDLKSQGIYAVSDGTTLTVHATTGADLQFDVAGSGSLRLGSETDISANPPIIAPGGGAAESFTIGGQIDMRLAADMEVTSDRPDGLFGSAPTGVANYLGLQVTMTSGSGADGQPRAGDTFAINYNQNGSADNRNGLSMLSLNSQTLLNGGSVTYQDSYGQLTEHIGILTSQARIYQSAGESMLRQSMDALQSVAGVNLEEEAARLIQLEQHYNASARLITLARDLFDTLLQM